MDALHVRQTTGGQPKLLLQRLFRQVPCLFEPSGNIQLQAGCRLCGEIAYRDQGIVEAFVDCK